MEDRHTGGAIFSLRKTKFAIRTADHASMGSVPVVVRVVVVDDNPHIRQMLAHRLPLEGSFLVVDTGATGREAIALAETHQPDLLVLDVLMPEMSGPDAIPAIRAAAPNCKILLYSALDELGPRLQAGLADAFVDKAERYSDLTTALNGLFPGV